MLSLSRARACVRARFNHSARTPSVLTSAPIASGAAAPVRDVPEADFETDPDPEADAELNARVAAYRAVLEARSVRVFAHVRDVRRRSRDQSWLSPFLWARLGANAAAQLIVVPRSLEELSLVVAEAVHYGVPLTARGGGTNARGWALPLRGGAVVALDDAAFLASLPMRLDLAQRRVTASSGHPVHALNAHCLVHGLELPVVPQAHHLKTLGGFIASARFGIGSLCHGPLRVPHTLCSVTLLTAEPAPRLLTLDSANSAEHLVSSGGMHGLLVSATLPLVPSADYVDATLAFAHLTDALHFCVAVATHETTAQRGAVGGGVRHLNLLAWPGALHGLTALRVPSGHHVVQLCAPPALVDTLLAAHAATTRAHLLDFGPPLHVEHARSTQRLAWFEVTRTLMRTLRGRQPCPDINDSTCDTEGEWTYVEALWRGVDAMWATRVGAHFATHAHNMVAHIEFVRDAEGRVCAYGIPCVRTISEVALEMHVEALRSLDAEVYHTLHGSWTQSGMHYDATWKRYVDPHGIFNPGRFEET